VPRLFDALALARGNGRHARLLKTIARVELLILDDSGLTTLTHDQARDLLEIVDDRRNRGSTIVSIVQLSPASMKNTPIHNGHPILCASMEKCRRVRGLDAKLYCDSFFARVPCLSSQAVR
jgi:DNA replication protein DnaC